MLKIIISFTFLLYTTGCDYTAASKTKANKVRTYYEIGLLPKLMSIPGNPVSVKWQIDETKENAGNLIVLLKYSPQDKQLILENSKIADNPSFDRIGIDIYDTWITEEAKRGLEVKIINKVYELKGIPQYTPDVFIQTELSPYVNGSVTPLAGGYIFISLYSM